ncbi:MAG: O-antigen ligase family protein [Gammaproteobacteria bacterium]|nr:O-antigen ligase family protein [Gammaproteobacteria bacterium]
MNNVMNAQDINLNAMQRLVASEKFRMCALVLLAFFPFGVVLVKSAASTCLLLGSIMGFLCWLASYPQSSPRLSKQQRWIAFALLAFVSVAILAFILGEPAQQGRRELSRFLRFLAFVPLAILWWQIKPSRAWLWWPIVLAPFVLTEVAIYQVFFKYQQELTTILQTTSYQNYLQFLGQIRAQGATHAILFGDLSLMIGVMALGAWPYFSQYKQHTHRGVRLLRWLPLVSVLMGVSASFLSGSRGAWLAIPVLLGLGIWMSWNWFARWQRNAIIAMLSIGLLLVVTLPSLSVVKRVELAIHEVETYQPGTTATSVGMRIEMWRFAWSLFKESPLHGVGVGVYAERAAVAADQGLINKRIGHFSHPHNEYLFVMASRGLLGLIVLLAVFVVPAFIFWRYRQKSWEHQGVAFAGLVVVLGYMIFGLTEAIFARTIPIGTYTFYLALISYYLSTESDATKV